MVKTSRPTCRGARGQALMIAVLVLFAVATLAALFAAIISSQLAQVSRYSDVIQLRNVTEAALRFANEQLTYGMEGADWRPSQRVYRTGGGEATVDVSYGPVPGQLQSRFMRIVVSAVFPDNPFLRHTLVALKPVLLTDYIRFITDRYDRRQPASLGVAGTELAGAPRDEDNGGLHLFYVSGPIRSNTDLLWYGPSRVDLVTNRADPWRTLNLLRDDRIEVAGGFWPGNTDVTTGPVLNLVVDGQTRASDVFNPTSISRNDYRHGFPDSWLHHDPMVNSWRVLANLPIYTMPGTLRTVEPDQLAVPRVRPPEIDALHPDLQVNRYLGLTRDSGTWLPTTAGYINGGASGWGWSNLGGIYVDNTTDIQYDHDLDKLRLNWLGSVGVHAPSGDLRGTGAGAPPLGPADWWDLTGRSYAPPGVEIVLHGEALCPYVEIIRHDPKVMTDEAGTEVKSYWRYPSGQPILYDQTWPASAALLARCKPIGTQYPLGVEGALARFPFPPNGVIYAEGNVRIRGVMPFARPGEGTDPPPVYFGSYLEGTGRSRRFDLQVVSGGTIYIEGDLLNPGPGGAQLDPPAGVQPIDTLEEDALWGSRLALLARDYVCVNTTALNPRPANLFPTPDTELADYYNDSHLVYPDDEVLRHWLALGESRAYAEYPNVDEPIEPIETVPDLLDLLYTNVRLGYQASLDNPGLDPHALQLADLRLIIGHSGWYMPGGPEAEDVEPAVPTQSEDNENTVDVPAVNVGIAIATPGVLAAEAVPFLWKNGSEVYSFLPAATPEAEDQSQHWCLPTDPLEILPYPAPPDEAYQTMAVRDYLTGSDVIRFITSVSPVRFVETVGEGEDQHLEVTRWDIPPTDLGYLLGPMAIVPSRAAGPLPVQIQALVYAQNGSWFIIPGPWFNEDPTYTGYGAEDVLPDYPTYREPLNLLISFYGAISENMPAPLGAVADWTSKWCGPAGSLPGSLQYHYDPLLRQPRWRLDPRSGQDLVLTPRFPGLPLTPDLVLWGERISGQAGA